MDSSYYTDPGKTTAAPQATAKDSVTRDTIETFFLSMGDKVVFRPQTMSSWPEDYQGEFTVVSFDTVSQTYSIRRNAAPQTQINGVLIEDLEASAARATFGDGREDTQNDGVGDDVESDPVEKPTPLDLN